MNEKSKEELEKGCILATIAHAIAVAKYPEISYERSWDGINYNIQNNEGTRGTITFEKDICVAAFRNENSERLNKNISYLHYYKKAPMSILKLAKNETLQYLLENVNGHLQPVITTAFWQDKIIRSVDQIDDFLKNGGDIISVEFMEIEKAIEWWVLEYEFSKEEKEMLLAVYQRKINNHGKTIHLTKEESNLIKKYSAEGYKESCLSFQELNIKDYGEKRIESI